MGKNMDGIICVDKPMNFTSFDVVAKLRGILKQKKLGHAGTLDPQATGVLPVFIGRATKAIDLIGDHDKSYKVTFRLGLTTDTQDIWGKVISEKDVDPAIDEKRVMEAAAKFIGRTEQLPPMYSAVKISGVRLYDLAREGIVVERKTRPVTIYDIKLVAFDNLLHEYTLNISCSKGTYIRTLCNDIGEALDTGACVTMLRRTYACGFDESSCRSLEEIALSAQAGEIERIIIPVESVFSGLERIILDETQTRLFKNGVKLDINRINNSPKMQGNIAVYDYCGNFFAIACIDKEKDELSLLKFF